MSIRKRKGKKGDTFQVYFPYQNELGVSCIYRKGGFKSKREAEKHETIIKAQILKDGFLKQECLLTLDEVFKDYYELAKKKGLAKNTLSNYKSVYSMQLKNELGRYRITKIKYPTLQKYFNKHSDLSIGVQKNIKKILSNVFKYACKCCYIENNPVSLVELTGVKSKEKKKTISPQEFQAIINAFRNRRNNDSFKNEAMIMALYIGYYTGFRLNEVLGLEKSDFDFINNKIHLMRQLEHANRKTTDKLKTDSSRATVPMAQPLKEIMIDWFRKNPYSHVICDVEGNYICDNKLRRAIDSVNKKTGIYFHFHMLRHTFISNLANNGVEPQTTKELARHAKIGTTMDVYTHINESSQREAINHVFSAESVKKVSKVSTLTN